jgi:hypothetical protein
MEEQKTLKENEYHNSVFDIMLRHGYTPITASQGPKVKKK